jgi:hypothetical protein
VVNIYVPATMFYMPYGLFVCLFLFFLFFFFFFVHVTNGLTIDGQNE